MWYISTSSTPGFIDHPSEAHHLALQEYVLTKHNQNTTANTCSSKLYTLQVLQDCYVANITLFVLAIICYLLSIHQNTVSDNLLGKALSTADNVCRFFHVFWKALFCLFKFTTFC